MGGHFQALSYQYIAHVGSLVKHMLLTEIFCQDICSVGGNPCMSFLLIDSMLILRRECVSDKGSVPILSYSLSTNAGSKMHSMSFIHLPD